MPARRVGVAWVPTTACLLLLLIDSRLAAAAVPAGQPTPPVVLRRLRLPGPVRAVMLRIDPEVVRFDVVPARPGGGSASLRRLAQRHHALAAINGDFSSGGWPAHLLMHDGRLLTSGDAYGAAFAMDATGTRASVVTAHAPIAAVRLDTGTRIGIARWNAGEAPGDRMAAFSGRSAPPTDHPSTCSALLRPAPAPRPRNRFHVIASGCGVKHAVSRGDVVMTAREVSPSGRWLQALSPRVPIVVRVDTGLPVVSEAFGGMPLLVHRGRVLRTPCRPLTCTLHPRTAAGFTRGCFDITASTRCRMLMVVVDGRRATWSVGMATNRLARLLLGLGAYEGVNLDGGASSQIIVHGRMQNRPAPGARRAVVSALIVRPMPARGGSSL